MADAAITAGVYQDASGEWRWRARARNGEIVADSSESYTRQHDAMRALEFAGGGHWQIVDDFDAHTSKETETPDG